MIKIEYKIMKTLCIIAILFCAILDFVSCKQSNSKLTEALFSAVDKKRSGENHVTVLLNDFTDFQWDRFFIFVPYTPINKINKSLGFEWNLAKKTDIHIRDDICLLVFVSDDRVVKYFEYPRNHGDFSKINVESGFIPQKAFFEIIKSKSDKSWFVFKVADD